MCVMWIGTLFCNMLAGANLLIVMWLVLCFVICHMYLFLDELVILDWICYFIISNLLFC
jgi:hypothetical protein